MGDRYEYKVKADNKQEAFRKLVEYFYGSKSGLDIKSDSFNVSKGRKELYTEGTMPKWFARTISASSNEQDYEQLKKYCKNNNIKIKDI